MKILDMSLTSTKWEAQREVAGVVEKVFFEFSFYIQNEYILPSIKHLRVNEVQCFLFRAHLGPKPAKRLAEIIMNPVIFY